MCVGVNGCNVRRQITHLASQRETGLLLKRHEVSLVWVQKYSSKSLITCSYMRVKLLGKKAAQRIEIQMSSKEKILNDNTFLVQRWHFHLHICPGDAAAAAAALPMHFNFLFFYHQHRSRKQQQTFWEIGAKNVGLKSCQLTLLQYRFSWWWTLTTHKQDASSFSILQSFRA